jgi:tetratricopeptide (TPR) repeat protein
MTSFTEEGLELALQLIDNGLSITGDNEILFGAKGFTYFNYLNTLGLNKKKNLLKVEEYANKVFELNPNSYMGHWLWSLIYWKNGNILEACRKLKKSLELNPNHYDSLIQISYFYTISGKTAHAKPWLSRLMDLAPLDVWALYAAGEAEIELGNFEKALNYWLKMYKLNPGNPICIIYYGRALAYANRLEESFKFLDQAVQKPSDFWITQLTFFFKYALLKKRTEALNTVSENSKIKAKGDEMAPLWMAEAYALINERQEAIDWLQILVNWGFINYPFLNEINPFLKNIRGEKRFKKLMEKVKHKWENFEV